MDSVNEQMVFDECRKLLMELNENKELNYVLVINNSVNQTVRRVLKGPIVNVLGLLEFSKLDAMKNTYED